MSASKFIAELERRKFLSDRLMVKLRESLAATRSPLSAEKLASFLVQKKHLTQGQADDLLASLTQSGVNLIEEDPDSEAGESSSIFGPAVTARKSKDSLAPPPEEDDEIRLVPIDEAPATPKKSKRETVEDDDDLPILGTVPPAEERRSKSAATTPTVKLAELGDADDANDSFDNSTAESLPDAEAISEGSKRVRRTTSIKRGGSKGSKKKPKSAKDGKRWDSPIILMGGGALVIMAIVGATIWFLLSLDTGEQMLKDARTARDSGAYPKAIQLFQDFLQGSPRHPDHSLARVELAMVKIRQPTEANDFTQALAAVESETKAIEDEPAFKDSRDELAALIPQIAQGLATQAEKAPPTADESKKLVESANKALELCNNAAFVPKQLRDEAKLTAVRDALERVERRQQSQLALAEGLKAMEEAAAAGKPMDAYAAYTKLIKEHPELADEKPLAEAVQKTGAAEQAAIRFVDEKQAAETKELPTPWLAALAVATHRGGSAPATGIACVRVDGAVYGLDVASGKLLWRRYIGFGSTGWPQMVDRDVIFADSARHELMRLDAATGQLKWRQTIKDAFAEPLIVGDRAFVASDSGRMYVIDLKTGARTGYLQFPQPLRVTPTIDRLKSHLYVAGDRASIYAISLKDMKCAGVYFLGHSASTIHVAPVVVMDKLAVVENSGAETSRLHLLNVDDKGVVTREQVKRRLNGLVTSPPLTTGRGLVVVTDRGQIEVYEITAGNEGEALTVVAARDATGSQPFTRRAAIIGRNIWLADTQLTKYNIVPTGNRLPVEELQNNFAGSTFDHPLAAFGDTLIEVHRPKGRAGAVVAAIDTKQGRPFWETDLAMPPAGAPVVDENAKSFTVATAAGAAFRFDEAAIRTRVQDQPLAAQLAPPQPPVLSASANLGQGRAAFTAANSDWVLLFNPAQSDAAKWVHLDSPLACAVTPLGQGFLAPLKIGQVFLLNATDGSRLAAPFQPRVEPGATFDYKPAGIAPATPNQFVITDGTKKIYLVAVVDQPQPHLEAVKEAEVGPRAISSPVVVLGDTALAVAGESRLVRFRLPTLEAAGETPLPAPAEWGPYAAGEVALLATVDQKLVAATAAGELRWQVPLENGPLAGPPLVLADSVILAYRKGIIERRALADGKPLGTLAVEQPLATGPVAFMQKLVVAAADGTLLVVDQPK